MTDQYKGGKWTKGKHHMKPDLYNSEFVMFFGTGAFEANFGPPMLSNQVTNNLVTGQLKIAVADPRLSKTAAKAWKWLPLKPGSDAALAYAMIRWMIDNQKYDKTYLSNSNKGAAKKDNETTWSNATWLVKIEKDGPGGLLRASDIGRGSKDGFAPGIDFKRPEDFHLKMVANLAAGDKPGHSVPDANADEMKTFIQARKHLSPAVFDIERMKKSVVDENGTNWRNKVVHVLNRGGRFEDFDKYRNSGDKLPHMFKGMFSIYIEDLAKTRHSYTGKRFSGLALAEPVKGFDDRPIDESGFPLHLIIYKEIQGGQSRTLPTDYWLAATLPENMVHINAETAKQLGFKDGDRARVVSATNTAGVWDLQNGDIVPVEGKLKVIQGMRPGVVAISCISATGPTAPTMRSSTTKKFLATKAAAQGFAPTRSWLPTRYSRTVALKTSSVVQHLSTTPQ